MNNKEFTEEKKDLEMIKRWTKETVENKLDNMLTLVERRLDDMRREKEAFSKTEDVDRVFRFMNELENMASNMGMSDVASKATAFKTVSNQLNLLNKLQDK